jgi:hypothetical protein
LEIVEEMEKIPIEKQINIPKCNEFGPSTFNSTVAKKHIDTCGKSCKKRKMRREFTFCELESILLAWHLRVWVSSIPVDGNILCEKAKQIADRMQIDNFAA